MEMGVLQPSTTTTVHMNTTTSAPHSCALFNGNQHLCDAVVAVKRVSASLSILGCLFMVLVIWIFRKYTVFAQRLILYLSIAAFLDSLSYLMNEMLPDGPYCTFQGWMGSFFDWSVLLWVCCITFNLYMNAIRMTRTDKFEWVYHVVSWGIPGVLSALPFISNEYGPAELWCWIKNDWKWRFGIWYCPLFVIIGLLFASYIYIFVAVNRKVKTWEGMYDPDVERNKQILKEDVKPLKGYPFIYLAVSIFPLINRIQNAISAEPVFALMLLHAMSSPLQGAVNAIVFGIDRETRNRLTWDQIKVIFTSTNKRTVIREYPVAFKSSETIPPAQELQFPKYNHISYSKLY